MSLFLVKKSYNEERCNSNLKVFQILHARVQNPQIVCVNFANCG